MNTVTIAVIISRMTVKREMQREGGREYIQSVVVAGWFDFLFLSAHTNTT